MLRRLSIFVLVLCAAQVLLSQTPAPAPARYAPPAPAGSGVIQIYGAAGGSDAVGVGDLLDIRVFNQDQMSGTARVSTDGTVDLPFVGRVEVAGQSVPKIEQTLTQRYGRVLKEPVVSVRVLEVNSRHVSVSGVVPRPGVYAFSGQITVLEALSMAGGVDPSHGANTIYLLHSPKPQMRSAADGSTAISVNSVLETLDLNRMYREPSLNRVIQPGDVIEVPPAERVFVTGDVLHPGEMQFRPGMTVTQAVSVSGGFLTQANKGKVRILRRAASGTGRTELIVDVGAVQKNHKPDVTLQAEDIVLVPGSFPRNAGLAVLDIFTGAGRWKVQQQALNAVGY